MLKKVILYVATLCLIGVAFAIYTWREESSPLTNAPETRRPARTALLSPTTQPAATQSASNFQLRGVTVPPGESPKVTVFDQKGNARIVFQAAAWEPEPLSETSFFVREPSARITLPGGQLAYIYGREGKVELQRSEGNNFNPKRGWLKGDVRVVVDRSKPEWREQNKDKLDPEKHPERIVRLFLDDVTFDMDLGLIESKGPIRVESLDGRMEGTGLELVWNETDRQIRKLRILQGRTATLRTSGLVGFGAMGDLQNVSPGAVPSPDAPEAAPEPEPAVAEKAPEPPPAQDNNQLAFQDPTEENARRPKDDRIDTYNIEFHGDVVARQKDGEKIAGQLSAALLQLVCEIGREERSAVQHAPGTQPAPEELAQRRREKEQRRSQAAATQPAEAPSNAVIEIQWTGELVATPIAPADPSGEPRTGKAERFHLIATGERVEVVDAQSGRAVCKKLEYHAESKRVWLTGTPEELVSMEAGEGRQLFGEQVFFDRQLGIARVQGKGRMVTQKTAADDDQKLPPCLTNEDRKLVQQDSATDGADIRWSQSVEIEFGLAPPPPPRPGDDPAAPRKGASPYLRRAVFVGDVVMDQQGSGIQGDRVEALFVQPESSEQISRDRTVALERIIATGHVRMRRAQEERARALVAGETSVDEIACERLEVEMTVDDTGRNVPRTGHAFGKVLARRTGPDGEREIQAGDELKITMASVPKPITPEEQARFELVAQRCGFASGSPEWQLFENRLKNRRRIVGTHLSAKGEVNVRMRDPKDTSRNLDLMADSLDCAMREDEEITRALVVGSEDRPAVVDTGDVYVKGPQIRMDLDKQFMEVPGAGRMRFMTSQDLSGRPLDRPTPVLVTWKRSMALRGETNLGVFDGEVRAVSGDTRLDCRTLRINFEDLPPPPERPGSELTQRWILKPIFGSLRTQRSSSPTQRMAQQMRKRATYIRAEGDAAIESTEYAGRPEKKSGIAGVIASINPFKARPAAPIELPDRRGPFVSRFRVAGPQIGIDLVQEHFGVEGAGNLLIQDHRLPSDRRAPVGGAQGALLTSTGFDSGGPNDTLFTWQSSMTFINPRNLAVFDGQVVMTHVSGRKAITDQLLAQLSKDPRRLAQIKDREAYMTCDNMYVEFDRSGRNVGDRSPLSGVTQIKKFEASRQVMLQLDDGKQEVHGSLVSYNESSGDLRIEGSGDVPAQFLRLDERTGEFTVVRAGPREFIEWNTKTRTLRKNGGSIIATGR